MGGMLAATLIGIFFVPLFYVGVRRLGAWRMSRKVPAEKTA
jgi:hypothetical protein